MIVPRVSERGEPLCFQGLSVRYHTADPGCLAAVRLAVVRSTKRVGQLMPAPGFSVSSTSQGVAGQINSRLTEHPPDDSTPVDGRYSAISTTRQVLEWGLWEEPLESGRDSAGMLLNR